MKKWKKKLIAKMEEMRHHRLSKIVQYKYKTVVHGDPGVLQTGKSNILIKPTEGLQQAEITGPSHNKNKTNQDERNEIDAGEKCAKELRIHYKNKMNWLEPVPWCEDGFQLQLQDVYTQLEFTERNKQGVEIKGVDFQECLSQDNPTHRILVEGEPGGGKSTLLRKLALDWANGTKPMKRYDLVVLLELRQITKHSTIIDLIFDQLLPEDSNIGKQNLHNYLNKHRDSVLILLDGADELKELFKSEIMKIVEGKLLRECIVIITSRAIGLGQLNRHVHKHYIIKRLSVDNINLYIQKFFNDDEQANKLTNDIEERDIESFASNPLNLALICILYEDCDKTLPTKLSELYYLLTVCAYKRYCLKNNICNPSDISINDCPQFKNLISRLGKMAYNGIKEGKVRFEKDILKHHNISDSDLSVGLLNREYTTARIQYQQIYVFQHKTIQEFLAAYYLHISISTIGNECIDSIITNTAFYTVCEFLVDLLGIDGALFFHRIIHNIKSVTNVYSELYSRLLHLVLISFHELQENQFVAEVAHAVVHNNSLRCFSPEKRYNVAFSSCLTSVIKYCIKSSMNLESVELIFPDTNVSELLKVLSGYKQLQSIDLFVYAYDMPNVVLFLKDNSVIHAGVISLDIVSEGDLHSICDLLSNPDVNTPSLLLFVMTESMNGIPDNIRFRTSLHSLFLWVCPGWPHKLLTQIQGGTDCPHLTSLGVMVDEGPSDCVCYMMANILAHNTYINKLFLSILIYFDLKAGKQLCKALEQTSYLWYFISISDESIDTSIINSMKLNTSVRIFVITLHPNHTDTITEMLKYNNHINMLVFICEFEEYCDNLKLPSFEESRVKPAECDRNWASLNVNVAFAMVECYNKWFSAITRFKNSTSVKSTMEIDTYAQSSFQRYVVDVLVSFGFEVVIFTRKQRISTQLKSTPHVK